MPQRHFEQSTIGNQWTNAKKFAKYLLQNFTICNRNFKYKHFSRIKTFSYNDFCREASQRQKGTLCVFKYRSKHSYENANRLKIKKICAGHASNISIAKDPYL